MERQGNLDLNHIASTEISALTRQLDILASENAQNIEKLDENMKYSQFITDAFNSIPYPLWVIDIETLTVKTANASALRMRPSRDTICYSCIHNRQEKCGDNEFSCLIEQVKAAGTYVRNLHIFQDENGNQVYMDHQGFPAYAPDGEMKCMVETIINVSVNKRVEVQLMNSQRDLRSLTSQLSLAEERERRRIATQLHDQVSQNMVLCTMYLGQVLEAETDPNSIKKLNHASQLIKRMMNDIRNLTFELSSPLLYELGLEAALEKMIEQMEERCGIKYIFSNNSISYIAEDDMRVLIFQSVRELLINVIKHSMAGTVSIQLEENDGILHAIVQDDGIGFDVKNLNEQRKKNKGYGLFGIQERLRYIGGDFKIESQVGSGTRVVLSVPLNKHSTDTEE